MRKFINFILAVVALWAVFLIVYATTAKASPWGSVCDPIHEDQSACDYDQVKV